MRTDNGIVHVKVCMKDGELVQKEIVCPNCGGEAGRFPKVDEDGLAYALLACTQCGEFLAEFRTNAKMETTLEEIWGVVRSYLVRSPKEFRSAAGPTQSMLSRSRSV